MGGRVRRDIHVDGIVRGVGFRPFVHDLATRLGLAGLVGNDVAGVFVQVEGGANAVAEFLVALRRDAPPLADIERVTVTEHPPTGAAGFTIAASEPGGTRRVLVSADSATCVDCLRELFDPADRRYRYPFVNCTNCGPRFTIVRDVPYDRPLTTMAGFAMCPACATEYDDPADRRFHAQPTCCPACGPTLRQITALRETVFTRDAERLTACAHELADRFAAGGRLLAFGNGGSSTDSQDLAALFLSPAGDAPPLPAFGLTNDIAVVTALSNDIGFDVVFSRQIAAVGRPGDVAVGLSTSGNSGNLLRAFDEAARRGLLTVGIAGYDGGKMAELDSIDHLFVVPSPSVHRIQEAQTTLYHVLWELTVAELTARQVVR